MNPNRYRDLTVNQATVGSNPTMRAIFKYSYGDGIRRIANIKQVVFVLLGIVAGDWGPEYATRPSQIKSVPRNGKRWMAVTSNDF